MTTKQLFALFCLGIMLVATGCSNTGESTNVAVLVEIETSSEKNHLELSNELLMPNDQVEQIDEYEANLGAPSRVLLSKTPNKISSVYIWAELAAAKDYFDTQWFEKAKKEYGVIPALTWFDLPQDTQGAETLDTSNQATIAIVRVPPPWYAPRFLINRSMKSLIPEYADLQGLHHKYFSIADDDRVGGIYLWRDTSAALSFYNEAWHTRIEDRYGQPAQLDLFENTLSF
ncbi:MAG: hypothetical protein AAF197_11490 [Pseudomonadota bacterium]